MKPINVIFFRSLRNQSRYAHIGKAGWFTLKGSIFNKGQEKLRSIVDEWGITLT